MKVRGHPKEQLQFMGYRVMEPMEEFYPGSWLYQIVYADTGYGNGP